VGGASQPFYARGNAQAEAANPLQPGDMPTPGPTSGPTPGPTPPHPKLARPANTKKPHVTRSGNTLTCNAGHWSNHPTRYQYRWTIDRKAAKHATGRRMGIIRKLHKHMVRCSVTATNAVGRATVTSAPLRVR
jgi:hypothetical protein